MTNMKTLIEREFDAFFEFETDNRDVVTSTSAKLFAEHVVGIATAPESPAVRGEPEIEPYDAGSLNDFGGGDVGWWHDYIRAELDRAYEFYLIQLAAAPQPAPQPVDAAGFTLGPVSDGGMDPRDRQPAEQQPDVTQLVEALERSVAGFDALSGMASLDAGARNYARQKALELNANLAAYRKQGGSND